MVSNRYQYCVKHTKKILPLFTITHVHLLCPVYCNFSFRFQTFYEEADGVDGLRNALSLG